MPVCVLQHSLSSCHCTAQAAGQSRVAHAYQDGPCRRRSVKPKHSAFKDAGCIGCSRAELLRAVQQMLLGCKHRTNRLSSLQLCGMHRTCDTGCFHGRYALQSLSHCLPGCERCTAQARSVLSKTISTVLSWLARSTIAPSWSTTYMLNVAGSPSWLPNSIMEWPTHDMQTQRGQHMNQLCEPIVTGLWLAAQAGML